jgi:hypothetical protein
VRSLALFQVATYGAALEAANMVTNRSELSLREIIPFGTYSQLLIEGSTKELNGYRKALRTADIQKSVIIENPDPRILKAYYHLENQRPQSFLLCLENEFAGYLLSWGQLLLTTKQLEIVEFRQPRFPNSLAVLVLTGKDLSEIHSEMLEMERAKIKVSFVEEPTDKLRSYFDIEVKS